MRLSSLLERFNEPETLKMAKLSRQLRSSGIDITDLSLGEPDFDTPDHIKEAAKKAIDDNFSHYTPVSGYLDLRQAICAKLERENGLVFTPEQITVSNGAKQCIANLILSLIDALSSRKKMQKIFLFIFNFCNRVMTLKFFHQLNLLISIALSSLNVSFCSKTKLKI